MFAFFTALVLFANLKFVAVFCAKNAWVVRPKFLPYLNALNFKYFLAIISQICLKIS